MLRLPLALLALSASAAGAQEISYAPDPSFVAQGLTGAWSGLYAGLSLGTAFGEDDGFFALDSNLDGDYGDGTPAFTNETGSFSDGGLAGAQFGYNLQYGQVVLGGIFDYSAIDVGDSQTGRSATPADYTIERQLDAYGTLRGRAGYAFGSRYLAYGTAGLAFGSVQESFLSDTAADVETRGGSDTNFGYAAGAGVEAMLTDRLSLGLEYLYVDLGDSDYTVNLSGAPGTGPGTAFSTIAESTNARPDDENFDFGTVALKLNYHF